MIKLKDLLSEGLGSALLPIWKIFIKGYKKPFRVAAMDSRDAKRVAYEMMRNNKVKIQKVVKEEKLTEGKESYVVWSPLLNKVYDGPVSEKKALMLIKKYAKQGQYHVGMLGTKYFNKTKLGKKNPVKEGKLTEGKFKFKGKYLYMPDGEVSSIPKRNERERILVQIKNEKFQIYDNGFNEFHVIGSRNDYYPKGTKDLERFLNKNKAKYIGIDR